MVEEGATAAELDLQATSSIRELGDVVQAERDSTIGVADLSRWARALMDYILLAKEGCWSMSDDESEAAA